MLRGQGIACEPGEDPFMAAVTAGVDREVATPETLARLADNFAQLDAGGRGVLLTVDHAGYGERPNTRAAGWIKALHAEGAKLWAWVELTPYGLAMVNGGEYAFFSTEYDYRDFRPTAGGMEPQRLAGCTLTNGPRHTTQTPCTNMQTQTQPNKNMDEDTEKTPATNSDQEPSAAAPTELRRDKEQNCDTKQTATNSDTEPEKEPAENTDTEPEKDRATNTDTEPEEKAANDDGEATGTDDITAAIVAVAELLGLPDSATPADLIDAVKNLQRSNDELRSALAEANKQASAAGSATNSVRYPHLRALNSKANARALTGDVPNRTVKVSVGCGTMAVNAQDKARADYCTNAVTSAERALGRQLTPAEYSRTWQKANKDYTDGVNR